MTSKPRDPITEKQDESTPKTTTMKVPVDPPGALGPLMHYSNGHPHQQQQQQQLYGVGGGGGGHPTFQPVFPSNWSYNPNPNPNHHLHHQQPQPQPQPQQQQQWSMPHFLAPLAGAVRHPFSFVLGSGNQHENTYGHMVHNAPVVHRPSSNADEADDGMSTDESMADEGDPEETTATSGINEIESIFLPSTFAPPEVVSIIRAKNEEAARLNAIQRQTRSMTSKKNRDRRGGSTASIGTPSPASSSKSKSPDVTTDAIQACSPPSSSLSLGGKIIGGGKVATLLNAATECDSSPAPQVMTVLGKKVTMIDSSRKIFVVDLISPDVCDQIRMMADNHTSVSIVCLSTSLFVQYGVFLNILFYQLELSFFFFFF